MMRRLHHTYWLPMMVACLVMALNTGLVWAGSLEPQASAMDADGNPVPTTTGQLQPIDDGDIRFVNLGEGRVLDNRTGLEWELSPDVTPRNHADALTHCDGLSLAGQDDWRLPERDELASLVDLDNPGGPPDLPLGHPFSNVQPSVYWSATTLDGNSTFAWIVTFNGGSVVATGKNRGDPVVWCVR